MLYELLHIIEQALHNQKQGVRQVLATVVALDGSSYRKPGVRMLLDETGNRTGAVSGGCVENEIFRRAESVFSGGEACMMTYDGRYRLGCEGILYILLEPVHISSELEAEFRQQLEDRKEVSLESSYQKADDVSGSFATVLIGRDEKKYTFSGQVPIQQTAGFSIFRQTLAPRFRLLLIGGEHDSVKLCRMADQLGWEVDVVTSWKEPRQKSDFPGAYSVQALHPDQFDPEGIDDQTAVIIMSHNFALDLKYALRLRNSHPAYLGIIGSASRRDKLLDQLMNLAPDVSPEFLEGIHSPAGLDIGSVTPEEISLSVLAEILTVVRNRVPGKLKDRSKAVRS